MASPGRPSARAGCSGAVALGIRRHLKAASLRHLASSASQARGLQRGRRSPPWEPGPIDFWDFQVLIWHLQGVQLAIAGLYLEPGIGLSGPNLVKLSQLGAALKTLAMD